MRRFGWFSSGRDEAARELLKVVYKGTADGNLPGKIGFVFVSAEEGEDKESDLFISLAKELGLRVFTFSARFYEPDLWKNDRLLWREKYHQKLKEILPLEEVEFSILAGYMYIVSHQFCRRHKLFNLHPALPGGPAGTWQEVIWKLIEERAECQGAMIHLVTEELDRGTPLTYFSFSLESKEFKTFWDDLDSREQRYSFQEIKEKIGEELPLFKKIREEGVKRELPLIFFTLKKFLEGKLKVEKGKLLIDGVESPPLNLNSEIEGWLSGSSSSD